MRLHQLTKIACRNISRNVRRTIITIFSIFIGVAVVVVIQGFLNGLHQGLIDNITRSRTGDIQIHHHEYLKSSDTLPLKYSISGLDNLTNRLVASEGVKAVSPRLSFGGMLSNGVNSTMVIGTGVVVKNELEVCPKLQDNISKGRFLNPKGRAEVVMASMLMESMKIKIGDVIMLLAQTKDGALNAVDLTVVGVLTDRLPLGNNKLIITDLETTQNLLLMSDEATEVAIRIDKTFNVEKMVSQLGKELNVEGSSYSVASWDTLAKVFKDIMNIQKAVFWVIKLVLLIIVVSSITNTMLMAVYERFREIGTMMAIGLTRKGVLYLFIIETMFLGIISGLIGIAVSSAVVYYFNSNGFTYTAPGTSFPLTIYPFVTISNIIFAFAFACVCSLLSSIYPAWKASKLLPTETLRAI